MPAACTHYLKHRDTRPGLVATLYDADGSVYDLTGVDAVWLHVSIQGVTFTRQMTVDASPTTGRVTYLWLATDWTSNPALEVGVHLIEYEVQGPGAVRATFPNRNQVGYQHALEVGADIGQA
jgi:hypothetical protein